MRLCPNRAPCARIAKRQRSTPRLSLSRFNNKELDVHRHDDPLLPLSRHVWIPQPVYYIVFVCCAAFHCLNLSLRAGCTCCARSETLYPPARPAYIASATPCGPSTPYTNKYFTMARQPSRSSREHTSREYPSREYTNEKPRRRSRQHSANGRRDSRGQSLPQYNHNGHEVTKGIHPDGESGRRGFNPIKFVTIAFKSSSTLSLLVNCLWPVVPVAIALV